MNREKIAKALGWDDFDFEKNFKIDGCHQDNTYRITEKGILKVKNDYGDLVSTSHDLLDLCFSDEVKIITPVEWPKNGTLYYCVSINGEVNGYMFSSYIDNSRHRFKIGNYYLTEKEAMENAHKWVEFYKSPEMVKVFEK